jgi:hypothetical protein
MASTSAASNSLSDENRQVVRSIIKSAIEKDFAQTLGKVDDIVNIFMGLVCHESSFRSNINIDSANPLSSYMSSAAYKKVQSSGSPDQKRNATEASTYVYGLAQVRGAYFVKGGGPSNKCEIERLRPDFVDKLCVAMGDSVAAKVNGDANREVAIYAGLTILEDTYKSSVKDSEGNWWIPERKGLSFPTRIHSAVAYYLGVGADKNGTRPSDYANSILGLVPGGGKYYEANRVASASSMTVQGQAQIHNSVANGPPQTIASGKNLRPTGCSVIKTQLPQYAY